MELYLAVGAAFLLVYLALQNIGRRQTGIEQRLLLLSRHLGLLAEAGSEPSDKVKSLASNRKNYVEALRTYRAETGSDFKQAEQAVKSVLSSADDA